MLLNTIEFIWPQSSECKVPSDLGSSHLDEGIGAGLVTLEAGQDVSVGQVQA